MPRKKKEPVTSAVDQTATIQTESTDEPLDVETVNGISLPSATEPALSPTPSTASQVKERITVVLDARGGLDLAGMRDATKTRLVAALKRSSGDLIPRLPDAPVKRWPEIAVRAIYSFLGAAEAGIAARKYPMEVATAAFTYTDKDMEALMEPTQAVLAKHAGKLDRFQEETALVLVVCQVHFAKMHALRTFMAEYEARQENLRKTPGPAANGAPSPIADPLN